MQRRQFITLLGYGAALGISGLQSGPKIRVLGRVPLFIGLGNSGLNFVRALSEIMPGEYLHFPFSSVGLNRQDGKSAEPLNTKERARLVSTAMFSSQDLEVSKVVLMASLSRATGGELVAEIARRYMAHDVPVSIVGTLPFGFEGHYWRSLAERRLADIASRGCRVVVIDQVSIQAEFPERATIGQVVRSANQKVVQAAAREAWQT